MYKVPKLFIQYNGERINIHEYNQRKRTDCFCPRCHNHICWRKPKIINDPIVRYLVPCHYCKQDLVVFNPKRWLEYMNTISITIK